MSSTFRARLLMCSLAAVLVVPSIGMAQGFYGDEYGSGASGSNQDAHAAPSASDYLQESGESYPDEGTDTEPAPERKKTRWWWPFGSSDDGSSTATEGDDSPPTNASQQRWSGPRELPALRTSQPTDEDLAEDRAFNSQSSDRMKWLKTRYPELEAKEPADVRLRKLLDRARTIKTRQAEREREYLESLRRFEEESRRIQEGMGREFEMEEAQGSGRMAPPRPTRPQPPRPGPSERERQARLAMQKLQRLNEKRQNLIDVGASPEEIAKIDAAIVRLKQFLGAAAPGAARPGPPRPAAPPPRPPPPPDRPAGTSSSSRQMENNWSNEWPQSSGTGLQAPSLSNIE